MPIDAMSRVQKYMPLYWVKVIKTRIIISSELYIAKPLKRVAVTCWLTL